MAATTAKPAMVEEANQSSCLPSSSMICNEPTHSTSKASPTLSMGLRAMGDS